MGGCELSQEVACSHIGQRRIEEYTVGPRLAAAHCQPAATLLGVASLFHPDILIEIEATAVA